ncbi:MAG TPA: secondary thiamine-phosphate synthase enzyme YjbQ [Thiobacillaceae bacterium]|nr:secondary thiamine-phosphate synthase enzyme YjbQ [Thiobacillaceae bacterium]
MKQEFHEITVQTQGKGLYAFTSTVAHWLKQSGIQNGLLTLFIRHTSASLVIQENADPDVRTDLENFFSRLVPEGDPLYDHTLEGPDDMPAHVRTALTQTQLSVPVRKGSMVLGTWQGLYVFEHRHARQRRQIVLHLLGE